MGELVGDRRRETEKEREKDTERGGDKQMFQNFVPTMTMKTQWDKADRHIKQYMKDINKS